MQQNISKEILKLITVIAGSFIDAFGFVIFVSSTGLITGGASGVGIFFHTLFGVPISVVVYIVNIAMMIVAWIFFGKKFVLSTIVSSIAYPTALAIAEQIFTNRIVTDDIFLCTVMGGMLIGIGAGLVMRAGASSGGMDIPALLLDKYLKISLSTAVYIVDIVILLLQATQASVDKVLYGVILILIYSTVIERVSLIGRNRVEVQIISKENDYIREQVLIELNRGVTMMKSRSGYYGKDIEVLMTVISNRQLAKLERIVHKADSTAFMTVTRVSQVVGEGFTFAPRGEEET